MNNGEKFICERTSRIESSSLTASIFNGVGHGISRNEISTLQHVRYTIPYTQAYYGIVNVNTDAIIMLVFMRTAYVFDVLTVDVYNVAGRCARLYADFNRFVWRFDTFSFV